MPAVLLPLSEALPTDHISRAQVPRTDEKYGSAPFPILPFRVTRSVRPSQLVLLQLMRPPENVQEIPRPTQRLFPSTCATESRRSNVNLTAAQLIELLAQEIAAELTERPAQPGYSVLRHDRHHPVHQRSSRSERTTVPPHPVPSGQL